MPINRFYTGQPFQEEEVVSLDEEDRHHLNVLRFRIGETAELVNGQGELALAELTFLDKKRALFKVLKVFSEKKIGEPIVLIQAIPKMNRLDSIVEKGTELGMDEIRLFPGDLSEKKSFSPNQIERVSYLILSALKQCGRLFQPKISFFENIKQATKMEGTLFFGDTDTQALPLFSTLSSSHLLKPLGIIIGPESGFSEKEKIFLRNNAIGVKLHQNILRTDTASLTALSLLHHFAMIQREKV